MEVDHVLHFKRVVEVPILGAGCTDDRGGRPVPAHVRVADVIV